MSFPPALVIRADANAAMGAGHVMRCLALAQAWKAAGGDARFCGRIESDPIRRRLAAAGFEHLDPGASAGGTVAALRDQDPARTWIVLDGYHFGPEWQTELAKAGFRVAVIDDGARLTSYTANVIVSPDHTEQESSYVTSASTLILAGPRFRQLRPGFAQAARPARVAADGVTVLVSFGGADSANMTGAAILALARVLESRDRILVVLGSVNRHVAEVRLALGQIACGYELHCDVDDMAALYASADLAVSAAGGAAWEMAVAGLPAVLVAVAKNQLAGMEYLVRAGAAVGLGGPDGLQGEAFADIVRSLSASPLRRMEMSGRGREACDGRGAARVCTILECLSDASDTAGFVLRSADSSDMEQIFRLANDATVRENSFSPQRIRLTEHSGWFKGRLASPGTAFFVLDLAGAVAALARFDQAEDVAEIDLAVHPAFRGRGLGTRILRESAPRAAARLGVPRLQAAVLESNTASRRCFLRAGFREAGRAQVKGKPCKYFVWNAGEEGAILG